MTTADIAAGMRLKEEAGWNQREADWRRLIDLQPDGCFVAELEGSVVGTVTTCRFGKVAWVAMMLVDSTRRGQGIGRSLMMQALESLDRAGVDSVRLDATPLGQPLYSSLGFEPESIFHRFHGKMLDVGKSTPRGSIRPESTADGILELDRKVTLTDRGPLLRRLLEDNPGSLRVVMEGDQVAGYLMSRPGSRATQIGPCIADGVAGPLLLADAASRHSNEPVFMDIPVEHHEARRIAESLGLSAGRELTRMGRGPRIVEDLARLWASAGPEKG